LNYNVENNSYFIVQIHSSCNWCNSITFWCTISSD